MNRQIRDAKDQSLNAACPFIAAAVAREAYHLVADGDLPHYAGGEIALGPPTIVALRDGVADRGPRYTRRGPCSGRYELAASRSSQVRNDRSHL